MNTNIFISYSRNDSPQALALTERLRTEGFTVWIDQQGIGAATSWSGEIVDAIEGCAVFIVLLSKTSVQSQNVIREVTLAFENKRKIIPVEIEPVELPREFKYHLAGIQRTTLDKVDSIIAAILAAGVSHSEADTVSASKGNATLIIHPRGKFKGIPKGLLIGSSVIILVLLSWFVLSKNSRKENARDVLSSPADTGWHKYGSKVPEANMLFDRAIHALDVADSAHIDEGKKLLENAIAIDSNFALAYVNLAGTYFDSAHLPMARKLLRKAMLIDPNLPAACAFSGSIALLDNDTIGAYEYANKGILLSDSTSNLSWGVLHECLLRSHDYARAFRAEQTEIRFTPRAALETVSFYMGWMNRNEDSLAALYPPVWIDQWIKTYREMPQNPDLLFVIFLALDDLGDPRVNVYLPKVQEKLNDGPSALLTMSFYYAHHHDDAKLFGNLQMLKKKGFIPKAMFESRRFKEYASRPEFLQYKRFAR